MSCNAGILIVDDEPIKQIVMKEQLEAKGFSVDTYDNAIDAEKAMSCNSYDVVLTDIRMPGLDGISFLRNIKEKNPNQAVIIMTAYGTVETAIEAMKQGAYDYLQKPFSTEELILKLDRLMNFKNIVEENQTLREQLAHNRVETKLIGRSAAMREILSKIHTLAMVESNVLIQGDSGTGKECVARLIHESSVRSKMSFIAVSCASLPPDLIEAELFGHEKGAFTGAGRQHIGRFELAHGGTIFLDDVDDIPLELQVKLLRVIQERKLERVGGETTINVNFRLIAATKKNLFSLVKEGKFREDLYYRLSIVPVYLPPLRERMEDVPVLCEYFVNKFAIRLNRPNPQIDQGVLTKLMAYSWPGNVRELENVVERMLVLSDDGHITKDILPEEFFEPCPSAVTVKTGHLETIDLNITLSSIEDQLVRWALAKSNNNLAKAASLLNIPRSSLQYKILRLDGKEKEQ